MREGERVNLDLKCLNSTFCRTESDSEQRRYTLALGFRLMTMKTVSGTELEEQRSGQLLLGTVIQS